MTQTPTQRPHTASEAPPEGTSGDTQIAALFAEQGLRCTRQRLALYRALSTNPGHPTAEELYEQAAPHHEALSLATVYNTLEAFCSAGIVQKLAGHGGPARYDATVHEHLHVRDESTGRVGDVPDDLGDRLLSDLPAELLEDLEERLGFRIRRVQIEFLGEFEG